MTIGELSTLINATDDTNLEVFVVINDLDRVLPLRAVFGKIGIAYDHHDEAYTCSVEDGEKTVFLLEV